MTTPRFRELAFSELDAVVLHEVLRLRVDVFVVEQACAYPEVDGHDPASRHLLGRDAAGRLVVYARWYEEGGDVVLGRIVVAPEARDQGLGRILMEEALRRIGPRPVRLSAQTRAAGFYAGFGFARDGAPYDDFGIEHVTMRRPPR